jgi:hypothetical protein
VELPLLGIDELQNMKPFMIRHELRVRGLEQGGSRSDLIQRLSRGSQETRDKSTRQLRTEMIRKFPETQQPQQNQWQKLGKCSHSQDSRMETDEPC